MRMRGRHAEGGGAARGRRGPRGSCGSGTGADPAAHRWTRTGGRRRRSRSVIYREAGQFKTSYASDQAIFPIVQDKWVVAAGVVAAFVAVPLVANEYWLQAVLIPFLIYSMAAIGLNLLTGYAGQLSLGTGGFIAVGAYAAFKLTTA